MTERSPKEDLMRLHPGIEVEVRTFPFSESRLRRTERAFSYGSNFLQRFLHFCHTPLEITAFFERLPVLGALDVSRLEKEAVERLFIQFMLLYRVASAQGLSFIDFNRVSVSPDFDLRFGLSIERPSLPPSDDVAAVFSRSPRFARLQGDTLTREFFDLIGSPARAKPDWFFFRFEDFASAALTRRRFPAVTGESPVTVAIEDRNRQRRVFLRTRIIHHLLGENGLILDDGAGCDQLVSDYRDLWAPDRTMAAPDALAHGAAPPDGGPPDRPVFLLLSRPGSRDFLAFFRHGLDRGRGPNAVIMFFNPRSCDVDLRLSERARNLFDPDLHPVRGRPAKRLTRAEKFVLRWFAALDAPVSETTVMQVLDPGDRDVIPGLVERGFLRRHQGLIEREPASDSLRLRRDRAEEVRILADVMARAAEPHPFTRLKHHLLGGGGAEMARDLGDIGRLEGENRPEFLLRARRLLLTHCRGRTGEREVWTAAADHFLMMRDLAGLRSLLAGPMGSSSAVADLKRAGLLLLEREYDAVARILAELKEADLAGCLDEFQYLHFTLCEKRLDYEGADSRLKHIRTPQFVHSAHTILADRYIYDGRFREAEEILDAAVGFFRGEGRPGDEIQTLSQLAKLWREKGEAVRAEALYRCLFLRSQLIGASLLSGYLALDLGNLFFLRDGFDRASFWYRQARRLFAVQRQRNGAILVKSNLAELEKISGDWNKAERILRSILKYDRDQGYPSAVAVDWFNLAHLEYLRGRFARALAHLERARELFARRDGGAGLAECALLRLKIEVRSGVDPPDFAAVNAFRTRWNQDEERFVSILQDAWSRDGDGKKFPVEEVNRISSKVARFELFTLLASAGRLDPETADYRNLALELGGGGRNYFYHEYQWVRWGRGGPVPDRDADRFLETFFFFMKNRRRITAPIYRTKKRIETNDSQEEVFRHAELVEDARHWRGADDFFRVFAHGLKARTEVDFIKLRFFEKGNLLFDLSHGEDFPEIGGEIMSRAQSMADHLDLDAADVKTCFKSPERLFYPYRNTKVCLWAVSSDLFGVVLLGFRGDGRKGQDVLSTHGDWFATCASLFTRFWDTSFRLNHHLEFIVGESPAIERLKRQIVQVSRVDFSLLIKGESGSGKELVARAVHRLSRRSNKPFTAVNAAAIPDTLLEAELFGYKRGAFTGAAEDRRGLFEAAQGGILFLDEIADLPLSLQAKVLRVLQEREVRRVGENHTRSVDFRFLSASNKDLERQVEEGAFREDLFYRIQDLVLRVPPLRDRRVDIPLLVHHFFTKYKFNPSPDLDLDSILARFMAHRWPGNVRELESRVKRLITYHGEETGGEAIAGVSTGFMAARADFERAFLDRALQENQWNKAETARKLGISRVYLFELIRRYGLGPGRRRPVDDDTDAI